MKLFRGGGCLLAGGVLLAVLCGCRSDIYYQNRAVERARKFLLKEVTDLDWKQREFVRYTDPVILHSHIVGSKGLGSAKQLKSEQRQICVTWQVPGKEGVYMVFGVSSGRMADWYPDRMIRKNYAKLPNVLANVSAQARDYARNNLFGQISVEEMNRIRFNAPALLLTDFKINIAMPDDPQERKALEAALAKKLQLTLTWELGSGKSVYFCGRGMPDLSNWQIERAGVMDSAELSRRTVRTVLTAEQKHEKLPEIVPPAAPVSK